MPKLRNKFELEVPFKRYSVQLIKILHVIFFATLFAFSKLSTFTFGIFLHIFFDIFLCVFVSILRKILLIVVKCAGSGF